ncbi:MAG: cytochrome c biogenesis protein CcdA [Chloroflexi bacterium]|jgi:cytochrome c-type biogenesis protein|nr:cytochrome c biogenesis protein CcdA [Chloroflexota bacterium]MBT4074557.1 cytochrome c biogenesis protein CcdA [Chloroflexota bacterium]MBT5319731.1 cytochrome c biogenesis protein CcdA [Chloroflexota bacterium]MBT6681698.1 cytochrome c biogenesis protein CcdA [Chloroflexota bacterium]
MEATAINQQSVLRSYFWPALLTAAVLGFAAVAGFIWRDGGFVTSNVLNLQGQSEGQVDSLSSLLPLGFAFTVGMVATVNPCGFVMLPAYLGLYIGTDSGDESVRLDRRMARAGTVSLSVGLGFILLFGIVGVVITSVTSSIVQYFDWIGLGVGILMGGTAAYVLAGGKLYNNFAQNTGSKIGDPRDTTLIGYFLFGVSYAVASLGCTLPLFLAVVASSATGSFLFGASQFVSYALGMAVLFTALTLSVALFQGAMIKWVRKAIPYVQPVSAVLLLLAGAYLIFYWLTVGGLADVIA